MTPDLEELIRQRAHAIWEREGHPHGRHEEHWQTAAAEITEELERIKAAHTPAGSEEADVPRKGRQRRTEGTGETSTSRPRKAAKAGSGGSSAPGTTDAAYGQDDQSAPRKRSRKATTEVQAEVTPGTAKAASRRGSKNTEVAQSEPASEAAPKTRRKTTQAAAASSDASAEKTPARRGRKPKDGAETIH